MTENEILSELKKLREDEDKCHRVIKTSRDYERKDYARASLDYISERRKFLTEKLTSIRLGRGISRTF